MSAGVEVRGVREAVAGLRTFGAKSTGMMSRSINKTLTGVRTDGTNLAAAELNLKKKQIRDAMRLIKASPKTLQALFKRSGRPIPLIQFIGTRALKRGGISVKVKKSGRRVKLEHAFLATMASGHVGVFARRYGKKYQKDGRPWQPNASYARLPRKYRLPIEELTGPRVEDILGRPDVMAELLRLAGIRLDKNIEHEIFRALKGI